MIFGLLYFVLASFTFGLLMDHSDSVRALVAVALVWPLTLPLFIGYVIGSRYRGL
jgi:hypothetical protein